MKKYSDLYTKEKVKEIEEAIENEFPVRVFNGAILKEFLKNIRLGKHEMILMILKI